MLVKCDCCNKEFERALNHINYNRKMNRKTLCSRTCAGKMYAKSSHIKQMAKRTDFERLLYRLYRQAIHNAKTRHKECNIEFDDIILLWNKQNGLCAITQVPMILKGKGGRSIPHQASIDRIDCNKGYIKDNIRIVCLIINYAHHTFSDVELYNFINDIKQKNPA